MLSYRALPLVFLLACTSDEGSTTVPPEEREAAVEAKMDAATRMDARIDAPLTVDARQPVPVVDAWIDPTAPTAITGIRKEPTDAYQSELAALVDYQRTLDPFACPGLLESAGCGNGQCDPIWETAENCAADCVPHLVGAYNDLPICPDYKRVLTPHSIEEVQDALQQAANAQEKVHPIGRRHSASNALCGDGLALDMSMFADVEATRIEGDVAYVQPGVTMIALGDWLDAHGLSVGYTHLGFRGVTVAGAIGTSAHGSSPIHNDAIAQRLVSLKVVLADGSVRTFREADSEWRALITSLGLLGVVVEVGVRVEPAIRLDVSVTLHDERELLSADSPLALLQGCDWSQMNWFPKHREFFLWCGKQTSAEADSHPDNVLLDPGVSPDLAPLAKLAFHAGTCGAALNELMENARFDGLKSSPPILIDGPNNTRINVDHAIGPAHRLTSADLIQLGDNKYFQMDWEVAVPQQYMRDALQAARQVFDAHDVSLPGVGAFLRFGKVERGGWLSYHSAGKEFAEGQTVMFFETPVAVPVGYSADQLDDYLHIYRGLISLFIRHFGARAHWGKNLDAIFQLQRDVGTYDGRLDLFAQTRAQLDPQGLFLTSSRRSSARIDAHTCARAVLCS